MVDMGERLIQDKELDTEIKFSIPIGGAEWAKMSPWMKAGQIITLACYILASMGLLLITMVIVINVLGRLFFSKPLVGMVEIAGMGGVFLVPFAIVLAERDRIHIIVKIITSFLPATLQSILAIFTTVLSIVAIVLVAWGGVLQIWNALVRPDMVTFVLRMPVAPFITIMVIGFVVLLGYLLEHLWEEVIKAVKK
ncbi:MAG: TRAP transporter small permease [Deltaproteobacteria bacterium]|nr:TRAP transporter small permease [Deltaproteobacteria bacterium]